jgi:beta-phosphoglucomutase-like phosphatase (HAD superfamily)
MFDAVIFDCDGVLVDSEVLHLEAEMATLEAYGIPFDLAEYKHRFLGMHHGMFFEALGEEAHKRTGRPLPATFREDLYGAYRSRFERMGMVEGAAEAAAALGLPRAVASSSGVEGLNRKLEMTGLLPLFEPHVYSADLVAQGKPAPDIFLYAAEKLGADPARCLVLEDSVNGVLAGRAAGMTVWGFTGGGHMDEVAGERLSAAGAERVIAGWGEARTLFLAWEPA